MTSDEGSGRYATGVPRPLWHRPVRVLRPRDAALVYRNPQKEFVRLAGQGLITRLAHGYFALVPTERIGADPRWKPPLADAGWGIAAADYGVDEVALFGPSAARHHGLIPRALSVAYVAIPTQRPKLLIEEGEVRYSKRDVKVLDVERMHTQLGDGWVTTLEQTALDLAVRPARWHIPAADLDDLFAATVHRVDRDLLVRLGEAQHRRAALGRLLAISN